MKKILFLTLMLALCANTVFAAQDIPPGYPPALDGISGMEGGKTAPEIDYISPKVVPLTPKEKKALSLSDDWARQNVDPVLSGGGKVVYVHGASLPTIVATPMQVSDVELEAGEVVNEIVVGDSARWMVESGSTGSGPDARMHLFIKPVDAGLESSTVITTNRLFLNVKAILRMSASSMRTHLAAKRRPGKPEKPRNRNGIPPPLTASTPIYPSSISRMR